MSSERDLPRTDAPLRQYAILSVPRSGSTLLARALEQTGQLGVPHEYLNPNAMAAWRHFGGDPSTSVSDYLKEIQSRRTSPSGWFAIKTHYRQFRQHFDEDAFSYAVDFVNALDKCILITREDHIAQAVSYYRARYTGMWTSEHESLVVEARPSTVPFDAEQLMDCLDEIETGEKKWREVVASSSTPCLEVTYEELARRYVDEIARTLRFLGVDAEVPLPMPTRKTAAGIEDNLVEEFRWYLSDRERSLPRFSWLSGRSTVRHWSRATAVGPHRVHECPQSTHARATASSPWPVSRRRAISNAAMLTPDLAGADQPLTGR